MVDYLRRNNKRRSFYLISSNRLFTIMILQIQSLIDSLDPCVPYVI